MNNREIIKIIAKTIKFYYFCKNLKKKGEIMTTSTVITNPTEEVKKLFDSLKERKNQQIEKLSNQEHGIFSVKV